MQSHSLFEKLCRALHHGIEPTRCKELSVPIDAQVDGKDYLKEEGRLRDRKRDPFQKQEGYEILRIDGYRVTQDRLGVRKQIEEVVDQRIEQP